MPKIQCEKHGEQEGHVTQNRNVYCSVCWCEAMPLHPHTPDHYPPATARRMRATLAADPYDAGQAPGWRHKR